MIPSINRIASLRRVMLWSAVAFGSVSVVSTIFVVTISTSIRRVLDLGADQLVTDQHIADQIVSSSYGQQLAAFRYLEAPNEATRREFRDRGQQTYDHIRQYLFRPMPLTARLKVEMIKEAHQRFEVAAQRALDLASRGELAAAQSQVLVLTADAADLERAVRTFIADRQQQLGFIRSAREAELANIQRAMILFVVAWALTTVLLMYWLRQRVMLSLRDLSSAVGALQFGATSVRVAPQRYQEFQLLADGFDAMATRIRDAQDELQSRNRQLVQTVDDLRRAQKELVQHEKLSAMGEMLAGLAHELNNPLAGILGIAECLRVDLADSSDRAVRHLGVTLVAPLINESLRARDLVRNLLHFSREAAPQLAAVQLSNAVDVAVGLRRHAYTQQMKTIEVDVAGDWYVSAAQQKLELVIINLVNNALDAMSEAHGTTLRIGAERADDMVVLRFEDNGPGFADAARSFDPFYTTKAVGSGTGLGLSLVHRFMQEFGGSVSAENVATGGARVTLRLRAAPMPLSDAAPSAAPVEARLDVPAVLESGRPRILVVDDEAAIREVQRRMLARLDVDVTTAANGEEACAALRDGAFDVVVTDLRMPGAVSGRDLLAVIRRDYPALSERVIVITGEAVDLLEDGSVLPPPERIVAKPFSAVDYVACVRRALAVEESFATVESVA